jgi:putative oxidoreductase
LFDRARKAYALFSRAAAHLASPFLLLIRLYWGWQFAQSGWGKLHRLPQVVDYFASLNIPFPAFNAPFIAWLEVVGGVLLFLGLASRPIALLLTVDMSVAYLAAESAALRAILSDPGKFYNADSFTFLFASLIILIFGPGKIALDTVLAAWAHEPHGAIRGETP